MLLKSASLCYGFAPMRIKLQPSQTFKSSTSKLSAADLFWVQCGDFRCMAYKNPEGKWINFYTGQKLVGSVQVIEAENSSLRRLKN
jgi:hypothetical protein